VRVDAWLAIAAAFSSVPRGHGPARVRVADVGGEEFEEADRSTLAGGGYERRQR
jgi:hypothetical protein